MMTNYEKFLVKILDTVVHGQIFSEQVLKERTAYTKFDFEQMINAIETDKKIFTKDNKITDSELKKMITKALALLVRLANGHDAEIQSGTGKTITQLETFLVNLWGKPITEPEYHNILNQ